MSPTRKSLAAHAASLIAAVCAAPADAEPRRRLQAWLEAKGHPLGAFLRAQLDRYEREAKTLRPYPTQGREDSAAALRHWIELAPALAPLVKIRVKEARPEEQYREGIRLFRGMAGSLRITWEHLVDPRWLVAAPLEHLEILGRAPPGGVDRLLALPGRAWLKSLLLSEAGLNDADAIALAAAPWPCLRSLDLSHNRIGESGAEAFVASRALPLLVQMRFEGNLFSPCESTVVASQMGDGYGWFPSRFSTHAVTTPLTDYVVDTVVHPTAEAMWKKHGEPAWARVLWSYDDHRGDRHNLWASLEDVDATGKNLDGAALIAGRLARVTAAGSRWRNANLAGSSIEDVDFTSASLQKASFCRAKLMRVRFHGASARALRLDHARLDNCDFRGADLREATFEDAVVTDTSFEDADLSCDDGVRHAGRTRRARFVRCNLRGANIHGRELVDTKMEDCVTEGMRGTFWRLGD